MHRRETILQTVLTLLTGLATTGSNVKRARAYKPDVLPALSIAQGPDVLSPEHAYLGDIMRQLTVRIAAHVQDTTNLETELNQISAEVYAALTADRSLGLDYVFDLNIESDSDPEIEGGETQQPVGRLVMEYNLIYEHSDTSAEA